MRHLLRHVIPPARQPLRAREAVNLTSFVLLYGGAVLALEWSATVTFDRPAGFLAMLATPWIWWLSLCGVSGLGPVRRQAALWLRWTLLGLLAAILADPRAVRERDDLALMYALDVSDSMQHPAHSAALEFITRTVTEKPSRDAAGFMVFGKDAAVELPCRATFPFEGVTINARVGTDATDLADGLSLAAAILPDDRPGRIVLLSDGNATEGQVQPVLDRLAARKIPVDVLPVSYDYTREVWLEELDLPEVVRLGETYEADVLLASLGAGAGRLVLRENGTPVFEQRVTFPAGKSRFAIPIYLREPGYYEYVATIEPEPGIDGLTQNNHAVGWIYLEGKGRVMVATDPAGEPRDWQALVESLRQADVDVSVQEPFGIPADALQLLPYDALLLVNVPGDMLSLAQQEAIRLAVHAQGMGLLMVGGPNSFGPGGYRRSPVEQALPVTMDIKQRRMMPKGALAIILHTCEFPEGNTWGKRIAKEAVRVLGQQDEAGVLAYDYQGGEGWVFPLTPVSEYKRMVQLINQAQIGDMPSFASTMRLGLDALVASDASARHMIIISDGDPSPPSPELVGEFIDARISVSMVAVFPHGGQDVSIMRAVAEATGGRYYHPSDPSVLPAIFIKEAKTLRRSLIQNRTFTPAVVVPADVIKGLSRFPPLHGYVLTTIKPRAIPVLEAPGEDMNDPVLAQWRYGMGKAAAFTSDLGMNWGRDWVAWEHYRAFVRQVVADISREKKATSIHVSSYAEGNRGVIQVYDAAEGASLLRMTAQVAGPDKRTVEVDLTQTGPRRYEGRFELWGQGRYRILATGGDGERSEQSLGGFALAYSPEYTRFRSNPVLLKHIAAFTGGRILSGDEDGRTLFPESRDSRRATRPIHALLLVVLVCLVPLDVAARRIQLDWSLLRRWWRRGQQSEAARTVGTLLSHRKGGRFVSPRTASGARAKGTVKTGSTSTVEAPPSRPSPEPSGPAEDEPDEPDNEPTEDAPERTTAKLLARKRRWRSEDPDGRTR